MPVIDQGLAGSIQLVGATVCSSDGSVRKTCDALSLDAVDVEAVSLVLVAVPPGGDSVPVWSSCPESIGDACVIPLADLATTTPLAPVVVFLPGDGGGESAPETMLTSPGPARDTTTHTFTFEATSQDGTVSETAHFECRLDFTPRGTPPEGAWSSFDWRDCVSGMPYSGLANGDYVFAVKAIEGTGDDEVEDPTPATQSFTISAPPPVPETTLVSGPRPNSWVFRKRFRYHVASTVPGSEFHCTYDGKAYPCPDGRLRLPQDVDASRLTKGTHRFTAYASAHKTRDFTPARRTFHVPLDDRPLRAVGSWSARKKTGYFRSTFRQTRHRRAALVTRAPQAFRRVALIAGKGPGHGTVKVFWNKRLLKQVSLDANRERKRQVIPVKKFSGGKLRKGRLRVVVVSAGKIVRIDGLGIARR